MLRLTVAFFICASLALPQAAAPAKAKPRRVPRSSTSAAKAEPAPAAATPQKWPVTSLRIEGNQNYAEKDILELAGLKVGDLAGKEEFEAARERLVASGAFDTVGYRFEPAAATKGYAASFQVSEIRQVYPFRFESLHADEKAMTEHLRASLPLFSSKLPATKEMLNRVTASVQDWLKSQGRSETVISKLVPVDVGKMEIVIQPSNLPSVAEISFEGNKSVDTRKLREAVAGPAVGSIYTERRLREILDTSARPLYEAQGRLRVEWTKIEATPVKDVKGLAVKVSVKEGDEYKLRKVEIAKPDAEDKPAIEGQNLLKEGAFELNEIANFTKIQAGVAKIDQSLRRKGFLEVKSKTARNIDDAAKAVDVVIQIDPGPQFTFSELTIQGLDIETEPHIRKLWAIKKGQAFNVEYPDFFLNRIREDGLFDNLGRTKSIVNADPGNGKVDVTLIFEGEKKPKQPKQP